MSVRSAAWLTAYILSIVVANWMTATLGLVPIGFGLMVTAGTFAAGAALLLRDGVQQSAGRWWALAAIGFGAAVSVVTSTPAIAAASGIAFAVSELVDMGIFTPLRKRSLALAVLASSIVSAPVDTVLFLSIAGFGVTWQAVLGQFLIKTAIALAVSAFIHYRRDLSRR